MDSMSRAFILSLPIDRLRTAQNNFLDGQVLIHNDFVEKGCSTVIYQSKFAKVGKITLISGKVKDSIYPPKCLLHIAFVSDISDDELNIIRNIFWLLFSGVNRSFEIIKDAHLMFFRKKKIGREVSRSIPSVSPFHNDTTDCLAEASREADRRPSISSMKRTAGARSWAN